MAALVAKFEADFTEFDAGVKKASAELDQFGVQTVKASETVKTAAGGMHSSFSQFDSLLASMGIHIGNEVKALDEMSNAVGKTASSLGFMATTGLAVGTMFAAYNLTRKALEFTGLADSVDRAVASLFNFGDATAAAAGANQDVLDKASGIAKRTITDINEARAVIQKWVDDQTLWFERSGNAAAESAAKVAGWHAEIARVKSAGNLESLKADIDAHNESLAVLSTRYGLSVAALQLFTKETAASAVAQKAAHDRMTAEFEAYTDMLMARTTSTQEALMAITKRGNDELTAHVNTTLKLRLDATVAEQNAQIQLNAAMGRDASGAIQLQTTALDVLNTAMAKLSASKVEGIAQTAQQELITKQFTDRLYEEAQAQDTAYQAQLKANDAAVAAIEIKQQAATVITGQGIPSVGNVISASGRLMPAGYGGAFGTPQGYAGYAGALANAGMPLPPNSRTPVNITNNMSGLLLSTDPQARQQMMDAINSAVTSALRTSGSMR